jgi:hypothetical protein
MATGVLIIQVATGLVRDKGGRWCDIHSADSEECRKHTNVNEDGEMCVEKRIGLKEAEQ